MGLRFAILSGGVSAIDKFNKDGYFKLPSGRTIQRRLQDTDFGSGATDEFIEYLYEDNKQFRQKTGAKGIPMLAFQAD